MIGRFAFALLTLGLGTSAAGETMPPPTPTPPAVEVAGCTRIAVRWSNVDDWSPGVGGSGVAHYSLYRRDSGIASFLANVTGGELPHAWGQRRATLAVTGSGFDIGVSATDRDGNTSAIAWSGAVTMPVSSDVVCVDRLAPHPPTGVSAALLFRECVRAEVQWNDDGADAAATYTVPFPPFKITLPYSGVQGYRVYRDGKLLGTRLKGSPPTFADLFGLAPGRNYRYTVRTLDKAGRESAPSAAFDLAVPDDCSTVVPGGDRPVAVYGAVFSDHALPAMPFTQVGELLFGGPSTARSLRAYFSETSYGRATFHAASLNGWVVLPHPMSHYCASPGACNDNLMLVDAVAASGVPPSPGDILLLIVQGISDSAAGSSGVQVSAPTLADPEQWVRVLAHEFSHVFRAEHTYLWNCAPNAVPGPDVSDVHFGCGNPSVGGDGYSPLGAGAALHHQPAYTKRIMGFLPPGRTQTAGADGTYSIGRLETDQGEVKDFRVPLREPADPGFLKPPFYAVEYRTQLGYDGPLSLAGSTPFEGLVIRLVPEVWQGLHADTYYVKTISSPLPGSRIFYDPYNDVGVKLVAMDGMTATVQVCGIGSGVCGPEFFD